MDHRGKPREGPPPWGRELRDGQGLPCVPGKWPQFSAGGGRASPHSAGRMGPLLFLLIFSSKKGTGALAGVCLGDYNDP